MMEEVFRIGKPIYGYADPATADWNNDGRPSTKYFNFVYSPYTVAEQSIGIIAFGLEVTDHVAAQKEAEQRQVFIDTISKAAATGLWVCGQNMECIFVNETWIKWTGKPLEAHLGTGWGENLLDEDRIGAYQTLVRSYETKQHYFYEYRIYCADGSIKSCLRLVVHGITRMVSLENLLVRPWISLSVNRKKNVSSPWWMQCH